MKQNNTLGPSLAVTAVLASLAFSSLHCGGVPSSAAASNANNSVTGTATTRSCDVSTQPVCPTTPPSFATDVNTIFNNYCMQCHNPNGVGAATTGGGGMGGPRNPNDPNGMAGNPNATDPNALDPNGFNRDPNHWDASTGHDWSKFANIKANATLIEQQVFLCNMPPNGAPALTDADRTTLLNWLKCGAPAN